MKVLVIPSWYPSGKDKLIGQYHKEYVEALNKFGIEANILFIERMRLNNPLKYLLTKKYKVVDEGNYKTHIYNMLDVGKVNIDLQFKSYVKKLDKAYNLYLKNNGKPDVIHAMVSIPAGYAACKLGEKYNIPVVVTEHSSYFERFFKDSRAKYGLYVLENSTFSTVSNYTKEIMSKYTKECYVLPNVINTATFTSNATRKKEDTFNLVSVCALRKGKNLDVAFRAIKKLIDSGMKIHYDIIGDGFYEDIYKKSAKEEGVSNYVTFLGRKNKDEISKIFDNEHALVISSELESFAIPGVEAMAAGLPVITTDCKGPTEYVDSKTGVICKVNDSDSMAKAIKKVYDNYEIYKKADLIKKAQLYDESHVVKTAKKIYDIALKSSRKKQS